MTTATNAVLSAESLVMVILVSENQDGPMPTYRVSDLPEVAGRLRARSIRAAKLFSSVPIDSPYRTLRSGELMTRAIAELKTADSEITIMTETCLCSYTMNGECYISGNDGRADVSATIEALAQQAVTQAEAGVDIVGPAAMLPESVQAVRAALDSAGYGHVEIMPHLIFRSELYANYRATMQAVPASGTRRFQLPQDNHERAVRTGLRFLRDGASSLLLEPALFSADVLTSLSVETDAPLLPFSVSGECSTLDSKILTEEYVTLLRAGASQIITYAAVELADTLTNQGRPPQRKEYRSAMSSSLVPVTPVNQTPARYFATELQDRPLRLGGRTSHLARAYAQRVINALRSIVPDLEIEYIPIETSADRHKGDLSQLGGKGLFMKEIDKALTVGAIDMAVHCMKDVPGDIPLPKGLIFGAYLERDDVRDCVVWREGSKYARLDELPPGSVIGTSAVRRKAQILRRYPHLQVERFRGNVVPRLARLDESKRFEALVLAKGGLVQVGQEHRIGQVLSHEEMCPAVGAGVIGVQCRSDSEAIRELLLMVDHDETRLHITAERTMLHGLQGHCNSPIAGHCHTTLDGQLSLLGMVFSRDGGEFAYAHEWDRRDRAFELGSIVAATLNRKGARDIIAGIPH